MFFKNWRVNKLNKQIEQMREVESSLKLRYKDLKGTVLQKKAKKDTCKARDVRLALVMERRRLSQL